MIDYRSSRQRHYEYGPLALLTLLLMISGTLLLWLAWHWGFLQSLATAVVGALLIFGLIVAIRPQFDLIDQGVIKACISGQDIRELEKAGLTSVQMADQVGADGRYVIRVQRSDGAIGNLQVGAWTYWRNRHRVGQRLKLRRWQDHG